MIDLNKLNCMNYIVSDDEVTYYLTDGLRSLWRFSKSQDINFKNLCITLLNDNQVIIKDGVNITMV